MYKNRPERIVATIEARMTSTRLPGKVLLPVGRVPALEFMIKRMQKSRFLDGICIATTTNDQDTAIEELAKKLGVECFRGSESDVLGRVLGAARASSANVIVEMTGDCPFADPALIDRGIEEFFSRDVDYASNTIVPTYPNGFDVQVFRTDTLADVAGRTNDPIDRTHVSLYIYSHPETYRCFNWEAPSESRAPEIRVTLDEEADYQVITQIADALLPENPHFSAADVVGYLLLHPDILEINKNVRQKEAYEL